ncbi:MULTISPECIES: hypothetical protein [Tenacibaculum]|uniref:Antitoxin SocA-like Panacea domain-containing protein n=1 Tax=Tenacibaculum finnmarkense genomovar ulcerans TaxID=2781388 RepID=A0A2I2M6A0_9FLAO|nr:MULTISPECIES: hypothetical protein [Tenacibaculum]MBE7696673.1 hypothetical protein [Tenacibaculum finnmarkense genomovar ulcerans]MCD8446565.1 hypothetical protein [Tenacibaculum finnmarkense genomovar finnmarkense]WBX73704.1 hypothetical protein PG913_00090 [Tenacibaculum pacificus]WCC47183.1 hypothetical protein PJH08_00185 [Tenacibaculum finnmarkense]SOU88068.1 hypothetical protein TNO010_150015 [Tenacibaculum finnmarkense genomovar ulcerans]
MIDIKLTSKAISEPIRHNAYYKLIILLAIVKYCSNRKKASIQLIHLVFWGLRTESNYQVLYDFSKKRRQTITPWSFEIGIDKILALCYINNFCEKSIIMKGKYSDSLEINITNEGEDILKKIDDFNLFTKDIIKIKELGTIPKSRIINANKKWTLI